VSGKRQSSRSGKRPERDIESATVASRIDAWLPDEIKAALVREAERQKLPYAELVREAIVFYISWLESQRAKASPKRRKP